MKTINKDWYKINGRWYHCFTDENGARYVDGVLQLDTEKDRNE